MDTDESDNFNGNILNNSNLVVVESLNRHGYKEVWFGLTLQEYYGSRTPTATRDW